MKYDYSKFIENQEQLDEYHKFLTKSRQYSGNTQHTNFEPTQYPCVVLTEEIDDSNGPDRFDHEYDYDIPTADSSKDLQAYFCKQYDFDYNELERACGWNKQSPVVYTPKETKHSILPVNDEGHFIITDEHSIDDVLQWCVQNSDYDTVRSLLADLEIKLIVDELETLDERFKLLQSKLKTLKSNNG